MGALIECRGCGGLKRSESPRCPHCQRRSYRNSWLTGALALLGLSPTIACDNQPSSIYSPDAYGVPPFLDSGGNIYGTDAYGLPPFRDAGPDKLPDGGDGGDSD